MTSFVAFDCEETIMAEPMWTRSRITALLVLAIMLHAGHTANAQLVIPDSVLVVAIQDNPIVSNQSAPAPTARTCSRRRRALIGGIIGGAAAYPLARLSYLRFANEGAEGIGSGLAALTMGGSITIGALVGRDSCK
jgi:hypothetical protein